MLNDANNVELFIASEDKLLLIERPPNSILFYFVYTIQAPDVNVISVIGRYTVIPLSN